VKSLQIGTRSCRSYLLVCEKSKEAALIDPLLDNIETIRDFINAEGLRLSCVIDTHTHADHLSGASAWSDGAAYAMHEKSKVATVTRKVADGETIGVGGFKIRFLYTPGHTPDSLSLVVEDRLLSGDFLFSGPDGAGRLDFPGSDPAAHFDSLRKLDSLSDGLLVFPAHEYAGKIGATLGQERRMNPVLSPRTRDAYLDWWAKRRQEPEDWMGQVVRANISGTRDPRAVAIPQGGAACACAATPASAHDDLPRIAPKDLAQKLRLAPRALSLLDVRNPEEYNDELGHIAGAVLIPLDQLERRLSEAPPGPLAVICRSGNRAAQAAALLRANGRDDVWVMTGGMLAWNEARLPTAA